MSNQAILWGTLILPWMTLIFMPKNDIKRYISVGLLSAILCIIAVETGIRYQWWAIRETTYPFAVLPTYAYGFFPIIPMWLLKYTYGHFGKYISIDTILNIIFAFVVLPWFARRGIITFNAALIGVVLEIIIAIILYGFQKWQEGIFVRTE